MRTLRGTLVLALLGLCLALPALSQSAGKADGSYTVGDKTTNLTYAYAMAKKGFFDETKEDVTVILSDVALSPSALADQFERMHMAADGKLHALELTVNSEKQVTSGTLLHEAFAKYQGSVSVAGMHQFDAKTFDGKTIAGKRRSLELSLARIEDLLSKTTSPTRREALESARAEIQERLAGLPSRGPG